MSVPGERVQDAYRRHFKHRYGGNAPGWTHISEQEQDLWGAVEEELKPDSATIFGTSDLSDIIAILREDNRAERIPQHRRDYLVRQLDRWLQAVDAHHKRTPPRAPLSTIPPTSTGRRP